MTAIAEDYVSFETAKLLKEKGFDEPVTELNKMLFKDGEKPVLKITLQKAMKWLREVHGIFISIVCCTYPTLNKATWTPDITTFESVFPDSAIEYDTYEQACEAAIKFCLKNLI